MKFWGKLFKEKMIFVEKFIGLLEIMIFYVIIIVRVEMSEIRCFKGLLLLEL